MMKIGVLVGRFQPFHRGHLKAVDFALKHVDLLYIAVGSAQRSHEPRNPFTAGERIKMIKMALDEAGFDCRKIIDRKSTRLNSSHIQKSRMPSSA